jgi:hypothetical protein
LIASIARWALAMSKAISVGCTSSAKLTSALSNSLRIGVQRLAKSSNPFCQYF